MTLDAVALAYLLNHCAEPIAAPGTMAAIVEVESGRHPYAINDNSSGRAYFPETYRAAVTLAHQLNSEGHTNLDLGIAQINEGNLATYGVSVDDSFQPCLNLRLGSIILRNGWSQAVYRYGTSPASLPAVIAGATQTYNSGSMFGAPAYTRRVVTAYYSSDVRLIESVAYGLRARLWAAPVPVAHAVFAASRLAEPERSVQKKKPRLAALTARSRPLESSFAGGWNH